MEQHPLFPLFGIISLVWLTLSCQSNSSSSTEPYQLKFSSGEPVVASPLDLDEILERGSIRAILTYSSSSYFIYKGQPMGFEYELIQKLGEHLGVEVKILVAENMDEMMAMLQSGFGDIVAHGMTVTQARKEVVSFTLPHNRTHQVLVQQKPQDWRNMKLHEIDRELVRDPIDLMGKKVSVREGSAYYERLLNLQDEIGGDIEIETVAGTLTTDELIEKVARGELLYTVADQHIALINRTYFSRIDIETPVSLSQQLAWMVRKDAPQLLEAINLWLKDYVGKTEFRVIYNKYFKNKRAFLTRMKSEYFSRTGGKLSPYDELLQAQAESLEWDWRLLASLVYQESQFDPKITSWAGAMGLMQVMPTTGKELGAKDLLNPQENVKAGGAFLRRLQGMWDRIPNPSERMKFILASYNAGPGHVLDAQRLAQKLGKDPQKWEGNVAECLLLKSEPKYYNDEVVQSGYCRGSEPYNYVQEILDRYEEYKLFL